MKAILVVDEKPKTCEECRYSVKMGNNGHWFGEYCVLQSCGTDCNENGLDKYCPLKPMPQKKKVREINKVDDFMKSDIQIINEKVTAKVKLDTELLLASGYNLCVDELLGEEVEEEKENEQK